MISPRRSCQLGLALVTAAAVAWSTSGLFTRLITVDTPTILFWRGLFGALGMGLIMALVPGAGGVGQLRRLGRPGLAYAALTALSMLLFVAALRHTTVAHVAVITAIVPFFAACLGWAVLREMPQRLAMIASTLALTGAAIMAGLSPEGGVFGDALAVLMALCMAGMILISRRYGQISALAATCLASARSAAATWPFATITAVTPQDLGLLALFGLVNQVLGFGLFALGARLLLPMETALITALDTPLAPLWVWLILAETPGLATLSGGAIVMVAVISPVGWTNWQRP